MYFTPENAKSLIIHPIIVNPLRNQELITMQHNQADVALLFMHKHRNENNQLSRAYYVNATRSRSQNTINHVRMV